MIRFRDFVETKIKLDFEKNAPKLIQTLEEKINEIESPTPSPEPIVDKLAPKPILTPRINEPSFNLLMDRRTFLEIDPLELSRQLTLLEFDLFHQVRPYECLDQIWGTKRKKEAMQHRQLKKNEFEASGLYISRLINHTNRMGLWVATAILTCENLKTRLLVMKYLIHLATVIFLM